jgi:hypothetical protein
LETNTAYHLGIRNFAIGLLMTKKRHPRCDDN